MIPSHQPLLREPPYDGKACPACDADVRSISARLHNLAVRWPERNAVTKLYDLRNYELPVLKVDHPLIRAHMDIAGQLILLAKKITHTPPDKYLHYPVELLTDLEALMPALEASLRAVEPIFNAHFEDERHCSGRENILRSQKGSVGIRFLEPREYNYTVETVDPSEADLTHTLCDTGLRLHDYFLAHLRKDRTFYGLVYCPTCMVSAPFGEFVVSSLRLAVRVA